MPTNTMADMDMWTSGRLHDGGHGHVDIGEAMGLESYICKRVADIIANMTTTRER